MLFGEWLLWGHALGLADGPSEVHKLTLAKQLLRGQSPATSLFPSQHVPSGAVEAARKYVEALRLPGHRRGWVSETGRGWPIAYPGVRARHPAPGHA